jgi:hypothetical protein
LGYDEPSFAYGPYADAPPDAPRGDGEAARPAEDGSVPAPQVA